MAARGSVGDPVVLHERAVQRVPEGKLSAAAVKDTSNDTFVHYTAPALLLLCAAGIAILVPWVAVVVVILLILVSPCIALHELGHLVAARRAGIAVQEYAIGFGPVLLRRRWKGVDLVLRVFPVGGFVRVEGMTVEEVAQYGYDPRTAFIYKRPLARARVTMAGVLVNVVLAWVCATFAVIAVSPGQVGWLYCLLAPLAAVLLLGDLLLTAGQTLATSVMSGSLPGESVLSLPQEFATGMLESQEVGVPVVAYILLFLTAINLSLALFNALPLFPLDGFQIGAAVVDQVRWTRSRGAESTWAPLAAWHYRWAARVTAGLLIAFVGTVLIRDAIRLM